MAVQATHMYDGAYELMMDSGSENSPVEDDAAGTYMWCLVPQAYTADDAHTTTSDLTGLVITGDYVPRGATHLSVIKTPGNANESYFQAGTSAGGAGVVQFGPNVTITAKYLVLVRPVTINVFDAATSQLIFYVDLTGGASDLVSSNGDFTINMHADGWYSFSQA